MSLKRDAFFLFRYSTMLPRFPLCSIKILLAIAANANQIKCRKLKCIKFLCNSVVCCFLMFLLLSFIRPLHTCIFDQFLSRTYNTCNLQCMAMNVWVNNFTQIALLWHLYLFIRPFYLQFINSPIRNMLSTSQQRHESGRTKWTSGWIEHSNRELLAGHLIEFNFPNRDLPASQ